MTKQLLLTAFKPYLEFPANVSAEVQRALLERAWTCPTGGAERTVTLGPLPEFRVASYEVDFERIASNLEADLTPAIGVAILMGQAPGRATIDLERVALNVGVEPGSNDERWFPLDPSGPDVRFSDLPLDEWTRRLIEQGFPARHSFHAGTYLCNASLYHALGNFRRRGLPGAALFLHLPLAREYFPEAEIALPMETILRAADATVRMALEWLDERERRPREFGRLA